MKETDNLKLKLPEENDWADVGALNENFLALDRAAGQTGQALEGKAEKTHTHTSGDITGLDEAMAGPLDEKADKDHTHTVSEIRDFPTALPASDVYEWAKQPSKPTYTASEVGAAASSHTHPVSQITGTLPVSKGGTGQTSLAALMSAMGAGKIVTGTYTGNGNESMTINLGFAAKAVLLLATDDGICMLYESYDFNYSQYNTPREGALCLQGQTLSNGSYKVMSVGTSGFTVYFYSVSGGKGGTNYYCNGNASGKKFNYIAFG